MNLSTRPIHARTAVPVALLRALQWRLLLLWALASLGCALVATLPLWGWLESVLDHSLHTTAIAQGKAPMLLADALLSQLPLAGSDGVGTPPADGGVGAHARPRRAPGAVESVV